MMMTLPSGQSIFGTPEELLAFINLQSPIGYSGSGTAPTDIPIGPDRTDKFDKSDPSRKFEEVKTDPGTPTWFTTYIPYTWQARPNFSDLYYSTYCVS